MGALSPRVHFLHGLARRRPSLPCHGALCHSVCGDNVLLKTDFENEMRGIRILQSMSSNNLGSLPSPRETLFQDFNDLLVFKIGVPPFFQFSLKQSIFCSSCNERFKQCKIFRKYIVKVKCNYLSQDTSITELLR